MADGHVGKELPLCQWLFCVRISQQAASKLGVSLSERISPFGAVMNINERIPVHREG